MNHTIQFSIFLRAVSQKAARLMASIALSQNGKAASVTVWNHAPKPMAPTTQQAATAASIRPPARVTGRSSRSSPPNSQ